MNELGIFIGLKSIRNKPNVVEKLEKYGFNILQVHPPNYVVNKDYYLDTCVKPDTINVEEAKDINDFLKELHQHDFKIYAPYVVIHRMNDIKKCPKISAKTIFNKRHSFVFCPNNSDAINKIIADMLNMIEYYELDGIVFDFIRYESFMAGFENFFTCFCEKCRRDAYERGYDMDLMKKDILQLIKDIIKMNGETIGNLLEMKFSLPDFLHLFLMYPGFFEWIRYKNEVITDITEHLTSIVKNDMGKNFIVSANILSPWWSYFSGQNYFEMSRILDFTEPMIYFDWMIWEATTSIVEIQRKNNVSIDDLAKLYYELIGFKYFEKLKTFNEILSSGLPAESIYYSVKRIKYWSGDKPVYPVLMSNTTDFIHNFLKMRLSNKSMMNENFIEKCVEYARKAGSNGLILFSYERTEDNILRRAAETWLRKTIP